MSAPATLSDRLGRAPSIAAARRALADREAWIVGGAVRDALLDEPVGDADLAVPPDEEREAARAVAREAGGVAFPLSERHATWRALSAGRDWHVDVSALRADGIEGDLRARDFTVNAVAVPLRGGDPIDPTGGMRDADAGVLRAVSDRAFAEDPLRLLRAARISAGHDLGIEPGTAEAVREQAGAAASAAGERQLAELRAMVGGPAPLRALESMDDLGLTAAILPELARTRGVVQNPNHHLDVYDHTVAVLEEWLKIERDLPGFMGEELAGRARSFLDEPLGDEMTRGEALRFGCLFHDLGKPDTRGERDGYVTFIGHDSVGAEMIGGICRRLRTSRALSTHLRGLAQHHLRLGFLVHERPLSRRTLYEYLIATEPVAADVTLLSAADRLAARGIGPIASPEMVAGHLELTREMLPEALDWHASPPAPPLSGDELNEELGIEPGPGMGRILAELRAAAFAGEAPDRDSALALARSMSGA